MGRRKIYRDDAERAVAYRERREAELARLKAELAAAICERDALKAQLASAPRQPTEWERKVGLPPKP
jgi:hypothetical protein